MNMSMMIERNKRNYKIFNFEYEEDVKDIGGWIPTAFTDYLNFRLDLDWEQDQTIYIVKGIHDDLYGKHFTFVRDNISYHAYTIVKGYYHNGTFRANGVGITHITKLVVV